MKNSRNSLSAATPQTLSGTTYTFQSWSDNWAAKGDGTGLAKVASYVNVVNLSFMSPGANYVAVHFHGEIAELVSATINRWDAHETADRLELLLGPDLQFIRINGTVVGARGASEGVAEVCIQ